MINKIGAFLIGMFVSTIYLTIYVVIRFQIPTGKIIPSLVILIIMAAIVLFSPIFKEEPHVKVKI